MYLAKNKSEAGLSGFLNMVFAKMLRLIFNSTILAKA